MKLSSRSIVILLGIAGVVLGFVVYFNRSSQNDTRHHDFIRPMTYGYKLSFDRMEAHEGNPPIKTSAKGYAKVVTGRDTIIIDVHLSALKTDTTYNLHLHEGSCRRGGAGGRQLGPVQSSDRGTGKSRTVVRLNELNPSMDHLIMVHNPAGRHILCADFPAVSRLKQR